MKASAAVLLSSLALAALGHGAAISIFNTGVDGDGLALADNETDTHWTVSKDGGDAQSPLAITGAGQGFPVPPWLADSADSAWITTTESTNDDPADYSYDVAFSLTGLKPDTVIITGRWATDNGGVDILVNGVGTGQENSTQFGDWADFSLASASSSFLDGENVLTFVVNNAPPNQNPTGLRVEFLSATADVIPEPASGALVLLAGLALLGRRRRS